MDRKKIEYVIIAMAVVLLIFAAYSFVAYKYSETELALDSISLRIPSSSNYTVEGDTIEFTNPFGFYNLNVTKTDSSDANVNTLLKAYQNFRGGSLSYLNESCYLVYVKFPDRGFDHHVLIIPIDSMDKDTFTFKKNATVWIFDANNREFVLDSAYNSEVAL